MRRPTSGARPWGAAQAVALLVAAAQQMHDQVDDQGTDEPEEEDKRWTTR